MPVDPRLIGWLIPPVVQRWAYFCSCGICGYDALIMRRCEECGMPVCTEHYHYGRLIGYSEKIVACVSCLEEHGELPHFLPKP